MEDIAIEAQVGKGTIYRYFASKDELYLKLIERAAQQYKLEIQTAARQSKKAFQRLVALTRKSLDFFVAQPGLLDLIQRAEVERGRGPDFPWLEARREFYSLVTELFREGMTRENFAIDDPHLAALLLGGGIRAILIQGSVEPAAVLAEKTVACLAGLPKLQPRT